MLGQHQPVGAGDFDLFVLQRADDRLEQFAALAHQDQNVAVARGAALDADRLARVDQPPHRARDPLRQLHPRTGLAHRIERRIPAFDLRAFVRLDRLPDFDHARRRIGQRDVRRKAVADPR